jgi:hypothetical protein
MYFAGESLHGSAAVELQGIESDGDKLLDDGVSRSDA